MIKYLAIFLMVLDHVDLLLFDREFYILSLLGRFAFPLFAFMLVRNVLHYSGDIHKYSFRLFIFAVITQPVYLYVFNYDHPTLNIFFTLFIGLYFIYSLQVKNYILTLFMICLSIFSEYSLMSLLFMYAIYFNFENDFTIRGFIYLIITSFLLVGFEYIYAVLPIVLLISLLIHNTFKLAVYDSLLKICRKRINRTPRYKYAFYAFYPLHLVALELLK